MPKKSQEPKEYVCCQCNKSFSSLNQFFKTYSGLYAGTGYLPICKKCLMELYHKYTEKYGDNKKAMYRLCMAFDLYYSEALFDSCNDGTDKILGSYIRMLNMVQYHGRTFDTSLDEDSSLFTRKKQPENENDGSENEVDPADIEKWGWGFDNTDYGVLNSHYKLLKNTNPNCDSNQEIFIIELCYTKMQQMKAVREGEIDNYNKLTESYRKSFQQAGLKTVKETNINEDFLIGVNAETIEKYTPAEYYKNKKLFADNDGIGGYIERFLLRPLRNLMHGTKDRDYEFYVKEEGDTDDLDEE